MGSTDRTPDFLLQLQAIDASAAALWTIPADRLTKQPTPDRWSALQCIDHLVRTNSAYFPSLADSIAQLKAAQCVATKPFRYSWLGYRLIQGMEPPARLKLPVPSRKVLPPVLTDIVAVKRAYEANHEEFRRIVRDAAGLDVQRAVIFSPLIKSKLVTLRVGTAIGLLLAHERRHLHQARRAVTI